MRSAHSDPICLGQVAGEGCAFNFINIVHGQVKKKSPLFFNRKISRLQFNKVKLEDAGEYSCEAENVLGKDTAKGSLNVRSGKLRNQRLS